MGNFVMNGTYWHHWESVANKYLSHLCCIFLLTYFPVIEQYNRHSSPIYCLLLLYIDPLLKQIWYQLALVHRRFQTPGSSPVRLRDLQVLHPSTGEIASCQHLGPIFVEKMSSHVFLRIEVKLNGSQVLRGPNSHLYHDDLKAWSYRHFNPFLLFQT